MKQLLPLLLTVASALPAAAQSTTLTFAPLASMPGGGRYGMAYSQDQQYLYSVGGGHPAAAFSSEVYRYSPATDTWTTLSTGQLPEQRLGKAVLLPAGPLATPSLYVLNGAGLNGPVVTANVLPTSGAAGGSFINPSPAAQAGLATWGGIIYTYGGVLPSTAYTNELRAYNTASGQWSTLPPMPEAKTTYGAAVGGRVYAIGGYDGAANSARIDAYDIASNRWLALGSLPTTVSNQAVAVDGEWLWLVGDFTNQSYLAAYNARTGQLRTFTSNLPPRRNAGAAVLNGYLYVWGGNTAANNSSTLADTWRANLSGVLGTSAARPLPRPAAYPNPSASGDYTLELPADARALEVHDALGRLVYADAAPRPGAYRLSLAAQPAGLYTLHLRTAQGRPSAACTLLRQ